MNRSGRCLLLSLILLLCLGRVGQTQGPSQQHVGRVLDWSYQHLVVSGGLTSANLKAARTEPRILFHLAERNQFRVENGEIAVLPSVPGNDPDNDAPVPAGRRARIIDGTDIRKLNRRGTRFDWSLSLGAGSVAANMFPAKFSFDINAAPDCTNDYVVFGLNVVGVTGGQANMVGVNKLYSGAAGLCGANPAINWSYNGSTAGGSVQTSTVLSLDGKKIAYVETSAGFAIFHVLTWKAGEGASATAAAAPTLPNACTATSSCLKSVTYSATIGASIASPWVDYQTDKAFVASNDGKIYRISCVFACALNAQPTVDWTFTLPVAGTGGSQAIPNGPVYDFPSGRLWVGDQLGEIWALDGKGAAATLVAGPVMIGGGGCTATNPPGRTGTPAPCTASGGSFGIPDSAIFDSSGASQRLFVFSGNDGVAGSSAVVVQMDGSLGSQVRVPIGVGSVGNVTTNVDIHTGTFDNTYFGATPSTGHLFLCGTAAGNTNPTHYWIGFTAYPAMNPAVTSSLQRINVAGIACVPYTELFNPNLNLGGAAGHHDLLVSGLVDATNGYIITNDISLGTVPGALNTVAYPGGISGVIIDNVSNQQQASNVYFTTLTNSNVGTCGGTHCAVKLRQTNLQ